MSVNPKIIPIRIRKNISNIIPKLKLKTDKGKKKKIEIPNIVPTPPNSR